MQSRTPAADDISAIGLATLCSLGAGLAAWFWYRDPKKTKLSRNRSTPRLGVEYLKTRVCTFAAETEGITSPRKMSGDLSCRFRRVEQVESCPNTLDIQKSSHDYVPLNSSHVNKPVSQVNEGAFVPKVSQKSSTDKMFNTSFEIRGDIHQNVNPVAGRDNNDEQMDPCLDNKQCDDPCVPFERTDELVNIDEELKVVTRKLKKLRCQSIDFLLTPTKRCKSAKNWKEIEWEIMKFERTKLALQNQKSDILTESIRSLVNSDSFSVASSTTASLDLNFGSSKRDHERLETVASSYAEMMYGDTKANSVYTEYSDRSGCESSYISDENALDVSEISAGDEEAEIWSNEIEIDASQ